MGQSKQLHIDGDAVMHVVASAAETRSIVATHTPTEIVKEFKTRSDFHGRSKKKDGGWLGNINITRMGEGKEALVLEDFVITDKQVAEPVENCLHSVKKYIESITGRLNCDNYKVYIGQGDTFRHLIPMPVGRRYKQNRDDLMKALLLKEVEEYMMKHHHGIYISDIEVDDKLSMIGWEGHKKFMKTGKASADTDIIVSRDKDTAGTNGWWYNPDKTDIPIYLTGFGKLWVEPNGTVKGVGRKFKYFQLLFGDSSDGYEGRRIPLLEDDPKYDASKLLGTTKLITYGQKTIFKELAPLQTDKECWELILQKYQEWIPEEIEYPTGDGSLIKDDWKSWLQKHIDFVHMRRWEDDRILFEDVCEKLEIDV